MKRKIELNTNLKETPKCIHTMKDAKVNEHLYNHYIFEPIKIEFELFDPNKMKNEVMLYAKIVGTVITETTFYLKIEKIEKKECMQSENEMKIFGYVIDYIANNWYTAYKKPLYKKDWIEDPETKVKARVINMHEKEMIVTFEI